ncbi:MAG: FtsX-like permease family protein [Prevotellaceae bacterium]|nr:FtsX-like permease family protein [Prevotellaceae bacterium]
MLSFFIAKRYLFAKKSQNVINLISLVSAIGVAVGTFALIVILSVYNGIDNLVTSLYDTLAPDLKITAVEGKVFNPNTSEFEAIKKMNGVAYFSGALEENALLKYGNLQHLAAIRGVDSIFVTQSGIAQHIWEGKPTLTRGDLNMAMVGRVIAEKLELRPQFIELLWVYLPKRGKPQLLDPMTAFNRDYLRPSAVFTIEMEADSKYVFVPLRFAQELLQYNDEVSSVDLYLSPKAATKNVQKNIREMLGNKYIIQNKAEQNETLFRMMQGEKWAIFFILSFVLLIASFNSIGSLTMLIIEKKKDIKTLDTLGAQDKLIRKIFVTEGVMISLLGCLTGIALGVLTCLAQVHFKFLKLNGNFVVNAYPVSIQASDIILVLAAVALIGYLAASIPAHFLLKNRS